MRRSRLRPPPGPLPQTPVTDALAATKFAPPRVPPGWVARPRLDAALERGLQSPLTLIAAPPGAGKTALLGAWVATRSGDGPLAWLSLESLDRDRRRFWRGGARGARAAPARRGPVASLTVHPSESVDLVVPELVNALEAVESRSCWCSTTCTRSATAPRSPTSTACCATRPARCGSSPRRGSTRRCGSAGCAWRADWPTSASATSRSPSRRPPRCCAPPGPRSSPIRCATCGSGRRAGPPACGWPRSRLRTHPDPGRFVAAFAGDDVAMADYLLAEVLAQQPPELVDFLLRTSVVSLVSGELATALTGRADADQLLARLEREHALVAAIGDDRLWHRYHPLLRELLRSELRFRLPGEVAGLHARAARWYAARARPAEALRHAADAGEWELVARLAGEHWMPLLVRGELGMLRPVLEGLPRERAHDDPEVALALAATILDAGDEPRAPPPFTAARPSAPAPCLRRAPSASRWGSPPPA